MKQINVSEDILPIGQFKTHASRLLRELGTVHQAIIITQQGKPAGVLIPPEEFDLLRERVRFISAVKEGLADAKAGRVIDDEEFTKILDERYGKIS